MKADCLLIFGAGASSCRNVAGAEEGLVSWRRGAWLEVTGPVGA